MASGIAPTESGPAPKGPNSKSPAGKLVDYDQFIDGQLRRTRGQVKAVEIAQGVTNLAVGAMVFFLLAVGLDHWIVRGGLGLIGRFVLFTGLVVGAVYYFVEAILPALVRRVNPVYAAQTIERAKPSLKNSLINFLLFRRQREEVPQIVYNALEEQAAAGLVHGPVETAVDRTQVIHRGYLLVGLAALLALYFVVSPKNPLVTIQRVMFPWTDVAAPARVSISEIQPGSATAFRGEPLKVSAEIVGLPSGEQAKLLYTTADRQAVDRAIPMTVKADGYRFAATLPEGEGGVQQDMQYHIVAGDAVSNTYRITAVAMPTIVVDSVDYQYPAYTGMEPISIKHRGDLKALEGTQVTLHAAANQPIRSASIDFNCDGHLDRGLKVDGQNGTITFPLALNNSRTAPLFDSYHLVFVNDQNVQNPQPVRHTVEVVPDLPPEVAFLSPAQEEIAVPVNGRATLEVRAIDPDFALASVAVQAKTQRGDLIDAADGELLKNAPHAGPFAGKYEFVPEKLGLHEGDVVHYQAVAIDNKTPDGNQATTPQRRIRIVAVEPINPRHQPSAATPSESQNNQQNNSPQQERIAADKSADQRRTNQNPSPDKNQAEQNQAEQYQPSGSEQQQNADQKPGEKSQNDQQHGKNSQQSGKNDRDKNGEQSKTNKNEQSQSKENSPQQDQAQDNSQQQGGGKSQSGGKQSGQQKKTNSNRQNEKQQGGQQGGGQAEKGDSSGQQSQANQNSGESKPDDQGDGSNSSAAARSGERNKSSEQRVGNESSLAQNDKPVPSDGSDDGSGVERILEHQQKESGNKPGQSTSGDQRQQGTQQQPGDQQAKSQRGSGQQENPQETVSADNQQKEGQSPQDSSNQDQKPGPGKPTDKKSSSGSDRSDKNATNDNDKQSGKSSQAEQMRTGKERNPGDLPGKNQNAQSDKDQNKQKNDPGAGAGANDESMADKKSEKKEEAGSKSGEKEQGGHEDFPKGNAGSGQGDTDKHGAPSAQKPPTPSDKKPGEEKPPVDRKGDAYPSSTDKHESDTKGEDGGASAGHDPRQQQGKPEDTETPGGGGGDMNAAAKQGASERSGGGGKGGGQRANQSGTGVAGEHTASDEGRGSAAEDGKGEKSNSAGSDQQSDQATGQAGNKRAESGKGSTSRPIGNSGGKASGQQPNDRNNPAEEKSSAEKMAQDKKPGGNASRGQQSGDKMGGGKESGDQAGPEQSADQQAAEGKHAGNNSVKPGQRSNDSGDQSAGPGAGSNWNGQAVDFPQTPTAADDPNLEYAKKATELALVHLKQAMKNGKVGDQLLKDLGWTREEAQQFVDRQEARLRAAAKSNPNDVARQQAEDALRSLGLRPAQTDRSGMGLTSDAERGMSTGRHTSPPPEYREQYKAFNQGVNQGSGR